MDDDLKKQNDELQKLFHEMQALAQQVHNPETEDERKSFSVDQEEIPRNDQTVPAYRRSINNSVIPESIIRPKIQEEVSTTTSASFSETQQDDTRMNLLPTNQITFNKIENLRKNENTNITDSSLALKNIKSENDFDNFDFRSTLKKVNDNQSQIDALSRRFSASGTDLSLHNDDKILIKKSSNFDKEKMNFSQSFDKDIRQVVPMKDKLSGSEKDLSLDTDKNVVQNNYQIKQEQQDAFSDMGTLPPDLDILVKEIQNKESVVRSVNTIPLNQKIYPNNSVNESLKDIKTIEEVSVHNIPNQSNNLSQQKKEIEMSAVSAKEDLTMPIYTAKNPSEQIKNEASSVPEKKPLLVHSYYGDMQKAIDTQGQGNMSSVLQEARKKETEREARRATSKKNIVYLILFVFLATAGLGVLGYVLVKQGSIPTVLPQNNMLTPSLIPADQDEYLSLSGASPFKARDLLKKSVMEQFQKSGLTHIVPIINVSGQTSRLSSQNFLRTFGVDIPAVLVQALSSNIMYGTHVIEEKAVPFLAFEVSSFDRAFSGMRVWEETMLDDIADMIGIDKVTLTPETYEQPFRDRVILNENVRAVYPLNNPDNPDVVLEPLLMYSFVREDLLVITSDVRVLSEITKRLSNQQIYQ